MDSFVSCSPCYHVKTLMICGVFTILETLEIGRPSAGTVSQNTLERERG